MDPDRTPVHSACGGCEESRRASSFAKPCWALVRYHETLIAVSTWIFEQLLIIEMQAMSFVVLDLQNLRL